jgi:hypothetical protein
MNTGYQHVEPQLGNFIHGDGKLGTVPLQPDGQWDAFLPEPHQQDENGFEVYDCVSEATTTCVEILAKQQYQNTITRSRRFLAANSGTGSKQGNDPQTVSESLRTAGAVYETDYPFSAPNLNTFYQTLTRALKSLAIGEFAEFAYGHSWVNSDQQSLMDALTYSPLSAAGYAWQFDTQTGYAITPAGAIAEHDFVICGYIQGQYWKIRDSYAPFDKKLAWNFSFTGVKRHTIQRQVANTLQGQSWWNVFLEMLKKALNLGDYARNFGAARSPQWPAVRAQHLLKEPACILCGATTSLQVHHIRPFHIHPELELQDSNLATLCTGNNTINCHVRFGHLDNFKDKWNPLIREDCLTWKARFDAVKEQEVFPLEVETNV